ncbi:MAG: hypothetical protein JWP00_2556 [Chloroflexi bacterium]|nr:hypothetical protein [Chloroflexota bacterium]
MIDNGPVTTQSSKKFHRDGFTWLAYIVLGYYSYLLAILGPVIAFLVIEFGFGYTVSSMHFSAFALGMFLAGAIGYRVNKVVGRPITFWGGTIGMALGALLLSFSTTSTQSVLAVFVMGLLGSLLLVTLQASLCDQHGDQRGLALTEGNIIGSFGSSMSSWLVGLTATTILGWRAALWLVVPTVVLFIAVYGRQRIPGAPVLAQAPDAPASNANLKQKRGLPGIFWLFWVIGFLSVSTEWCIGFWSIDFLTKVTGLSKAEAALVMGLYFIIVMASRLVSSRLIRTLPATLLLPWQVGFVLVGFPLFWLVSEPLLSILGLLVLGIGVANLVPLNISAAIGIVPDKADLASGRLTSGSGLALLISPFALGWLADLVGIQPAFGFIMVLTLLVFALTIFAYFKSKPAGELV